RAGRPPPRPGRLSGHSHRESWTRAGDGSHVRHLAPHAQGEKVVQRSVVLAGLGAATIASAGMGMRPVVADTYPHVTANIDVTEPNKSPVRDDAIPAVAVDPNDSSHVVVAEGDFRTGTCQLHVSTDGGATFTVAKRSFLPSFFDHCTPNAGNTSFPMAWGQD